MTLQRYFLFYFQQNLKSVFPGLSDVLLDGTERPIQRSCDYELQEEQFSGKKKTLHQK